MDTLGIAIPDVQVCPNHSTPWRAFSQAYFAGAPTSVWLASRGLGGKSYLLSALAWTEAVTLKADVNVLGGSGEQSENVLKYVNRHWRQPKAPRDMLADDPAKRVNRLVTGNELRALLASQASVRGPHPQRLRLDEADEMDLPILDAALGQPMEGRGITEQTVISSTHHYADGTMTEVLRRAAEKGWAVHEWCYRENLEPHGWLSAAQVQRKREQLTDAMWQTEVELQEPAPESRAIVPEKVEAMFRPELGMYRGALGEYIEIEPPQQGATYSTGADWAKKQDYTVIWTLRTDTRPARFVAFRRVAREPWPNMVGYFDDQVKRYGGAAFHDATGLGTVVADLLTVPAQDVTLVGRLRADLFSNYIKRIENGELEAPRIDFAYSEHKFVSRDDLYGSGHPPDSFVAGAVAALGLPMSGPVVLFETEW